ncbi:hypothetical protein V3481_018913 [Fusarium oxysporum f. sp. vasinfectum]
MSNDPVNKQREAATPFRDGEPDSMDLKKDSLTPAKSVRYTSKEMDPSISLMHSYIRVSSLLPEASRQAVSLRHYVTFT